MGSYSLIEVVEIIEDNDGKVEPHQCEDEDAEKEKEPAAVTLKTRDDNYAHICRAPSSWPGCREPWGALSRVHRGPQQALSCPMEREQSSPGEFLRLDPCYKKMDHHPLQHAKKLRMPGWGGQPLWQDCLLSYAAAPKSRLGLRMQEGTGSQVLCPSSRVICWLAERATVPQSCHWSGEPADCSCLRS